MNTAIRNVVQRLLRATGRDYKISSEIPATVLAGEAAQRGLQLIRGGVRTRRPVFLGPGVRVRGHRRLDLASGSAVGDGCLLDARGRLGIRLEKGSRLGRRGIVTTTSHLSLFGTGLTLGAGSGVGDYFHIGASGGVVIGENVIVGPFLTVHSQEHNYEDPARPIRTQGTRQEAVKIGNDCWIGARVTLLAGTELGPRTIVAAGAVVRGKHRGNEILGGIPARRLREL